eukprot:CAMPEP_0117688482 /NCGR_PEP_ID=MMETSP0804-20121206/23857_1 /TAXON_ID=1074897 /ORGANISM="Tetraselmis astigmatica, Strain CCMP880" /LENGTH=113 /DNA_ID=CAMNT_0005500945 /DNA_START=374 /DNA_END=712 /DNA_ORIENTATION=-
MTVLQAAEAWHIPWKQCGSGKLHGQGAAGGGFRRDALPGMPPSYCVLLWAGEGPKGMEHLVTGLARFSSLDTALGDLRDSGTVLEPQVQLANSQQVCELLQGMVCAGEQGLPA